MDMFNNVLKNINIETIKTTEFIKGKLKSFKVDPFGWAKEYIYGIDKDYRLIKTSKISCFLHGDGEATLLHADGLAGFRNDDYKDKLKEISQEDNKENRQFDILVANPPYSISGF